MTSILELSELESDDLELVPEILPVDARLSIKGDVATLLELFSRAAAISPTKEVIAGTSFALLEAVPASAGTLAFVRVTATDGDQTVSVVTDSLTINMSGSVLVPAKRMLDILKLAPAITVRIDVLGSSATLLSGRAQWTVQTPSGDALPPTADVSDVPTSVVEREPFLAALVAVRSAVGSGSGRPALGQIMIRNGAVTACDGGRLHRHTIASFDPMIEMSIPVKVLEEVIRALRASDETHIDVGANDYHLVFKIGRDTLIAQRLLVQFPDVESLILGPAFSNLHQLTIDPPALAAAVKRVRINSDPDNAGIFLALVKGGILSDGTPADWSLAVRARDRSGNTSQEMIECAWEGPQKPREWCLNHRYLTDLLEAFTGQTLNFKAGDDLKTVRTPLFVEDEGGFTGFIQQMNPNWVQ